MSVATASPAGDTPRRPFKSAAEVVAGSGLPGPLGQRVLDVTGKLRLWPRERVDVARELVSHFAEGLEQGQTLDTLLHAFGDAKQAAELISRAKRRQRPRLWKIGRAFGFLLLGLALVYGVLALRYFTGKPTIAIDYLARLNEPTLKTPVEQRAWPLYREAYLQLPDPPTIDGERVELGSVQPGTPQWDAAAKYAREQSPIIAKIRHAATLPVSGHVLSHEPDFNPSLRPGRIPVEVPPTTRRTITGLDTSARESGPLDDALIGVLLPNMTVYREFARLLTFDARLAASEGDARRSLANIKAVNAMARHSNDTGGMLIGQLVNLAIYSLNARAAGEVVIRWPDTFGDAELRELAASFAAWQANPLKKDDSLSLDGERAMMYDLLQRIYTDDGHGDGRLAQMHALRLVGSLQDDAERGTDWLAGPIAAQLVAGRADMKEAYDEALDTVLTPTPMTIPERNAGRAQWNERFDEPVWRSRYILAALLLPALDKASLSVTTTVARREATIAGLALERYRLANGNYPAALADLVPTYLASVPTDPWNGQPIRYIAPNGNRTLPLLYSVGENLVDNGGDGSSVPVPAGSGRAPNAVMFNDLILWPSP